MKKYFVAGVAIVCLGLIGSAVASPIMWNTISGSGACTSEIGNSCTFTGNDGEVLKASAYATNNNPGTGAFKKATLTIWDGGLGVKNSDQSTEGSNPNYAVDNYGRDELVVFEYVYPIDFISYGFTGFEIGWRYSDSDISVWIGGESLSANYDFTGKKFSDLANLGFTKFDFNNVPINTFQSLTNVAGHYLLIAPKVNGGGNDFFKISQISGEMTSTRTPPAEVPEPNNIALIGIALIGLWATRRKKGSRRLPLGV